MWDTLRRQLPGIAGASAFWIAVLGVVVLFGMRRPPPQPIQILAPVETTVPAVLPTPVPTPGPLRVYVSGAVAKLGVYRLAPDSLVDDAVTAAGGALAAADLVAINLAQGVSDGDQVHVPAVGETGTAPAVGSRGPAVESGVNDVGPLVDLNTATVAELEALPEIGPKTAAAIIEGRPYGAVEDLLRVDGIGDATLEKLRPYVTVE